MFAEVGVGEGKGAEEAVAAQDVEGAAEVAEEKEGEDDVADAKRAFCQFKEKGREKKLGAGGWYRLRLELKSLRREWAWDRPSLACRLTGSADEPIAAVSVLYRLTTAPERSVWKLARHRVKINIRPCNITSLLGFLNCLFYAQFK